MKKILISILLISLFFVFSCKTTEVQEDPDMTEAEYNELKDLKTLVDKYGLAEYAPDDAKIAEEKYGEVESLYPTDKKEARKAYVISKTSYLAVIEKSWPILVDRRKQEADEKKMSADNIKADVAVKEDYDDALATYNQAITEKDAGNYESSADLMQEAIDKFDAVYKAAKEKKDRADNAIEDLKKGQEEYEKTDQENGAEGTEPGTEADGTAQPDGTQPDNGQAQ